MENTMKSAKNWNIWLQSIQLLSGKSFPLWGGDFLEPFVKIHICTYLFFSYFHRTGCPKKWTMPWSGLKIETYDFNNCSYPKKCFPLWGGNFHEPLVLNTYIPLFKVYFHHTGCPKKWKMPWNGLKIDVYDFNQSLFWDTMYGENLL